MKTLAKALIPLLLILFVIVPGVTGFLVESAIHNSDEEVSSLLRLEGVNLLDSSFERGWFGSTQSAEFKLNDPALIAFLGTLAGPAAVDDLPTLVIETQATHGVLPLASPSKGGLKPAAAQTHSQLFLKYPSGQKVELPVDVYASVGLSGWAKLIAQPVTRKIEQGGTTTSLEWAGAEIEGSGDFQKTGDLVGEIGHLTITSPGGKLELSPTTLSATFEKGAYSYHDAKFALEIPAAAVEMQSGGQLRLTDLRVNTSLDTLDNRAAGAHTMRTGALAVAGVNLNSTDVSVRFDLDAQAFSDFFAIAQQTSMDSGHPGNDAAALESAFVDMVSKGGTVTFEKLDIDLDGSMIHLDLHLDIPPGHGDIATAMQNGNGSGKIVLPQTAIDMLASRSQQAAFMFQMGTSAGFFQKKGNQYTADVKYEDGLLLLNGLPMPLPF